MSEKEITFSTMEEMSENEGYAPPAVEANEAPLAEDVVPLWDSAEEEELAADGDAEGNGAVEEDSASSPGTDEPPLYESAVPMIDDETAPDKEQPAPPVEEIRPSAERRAAAASHVARVRPAARQNAPVLTIEKHGEAETEAARTDVVWHEIHNAYLTRRLLTGQLGGIEQTENGKTLAVVDYKGFRVVIPLKEMMIELSGTPKDPRETLLRQNKLLGNMLGAQIDFVIKGIDSKTRSVVASRRDAMLKKRRVFYFGTDAQGMYRIHDGRIVQARVIAVAEKGVRVEAFGVECSILARDLSWDWVGDARERHAVGDEILIRIQNVRRESPEDVSIQADIKSITPNAGREALGKCRVQSKYAGRVTDVRRGVVYIRLANGVNAIAHSCFDPRTPGKKDDVSFAVTHIDEEKCVAVGIITRIIRQNL